MAGSNSLQNAQETDALLVHNNSYGGINDSRNSNDNLSKSKCQTSTEALWHHLHAEIDIRHGDLIVLYCYIITGVLDSSAVFIWGSFVSMQTGNTVYLGLGLAGVEREESAAGGDRWIKSGISIASFCIGSALFGWFHRNFSARRRWVLCAAFAIQMLCIICAAVIVTVAHPSKNSRLTWKVLVPLALVAFQSSGQAVGSRVLKQAGLSSVVLTSIYCDLFSHPDLVSPSLAILRNVEERRRAAAVVCLLLGTVSGGLWARSSVGLMGALWTAVVLKVTIIVAWLLWRADKTNNSETQP